MTTVLVVENEERVLDAIVPGLVHAHFTVCVARSAADVLEHFEASSPAIVLIDTALPDRHGIDVVRALRSVSDVPIVMISADDSELDIIVSLEVGADDVVTDPFRVFELVARLRAVLRRCQPEADRLLAATTGPRTDAVSWNQPSDQGVITVGDVSLDRIRHEVTVAGTVVRLPLKQFQLLSLLLENAGRVLPRDVLIREIWGLDYYGDTKTLDAHATRLRAAIESEPSRPTRVLTIRGVGYRFNPTPVARSIAPDERPDRRLATHLELVSA